MSKRIPKKINNLNPKLPIGEFYVNGKHGYRETGSQAVFLYRLVYSSTYSFVACLLLLVSFLFQGVDFAYADESELETDTVISLEESLNLDNETDVLNEVQQEDLNNLIIDSEQNNSIDENIDTELVETEDEILNLDDEVSPSDDSLSYEEDLNLDDTELLVDEDLNEKEIEESVDEEDEILSEADLIASTTETVSIVQSDSAFSFTKNECTQLANGSFYCIKPQENVLKDALFAAPDEQGDLEIYFVRDGNQMQVTDNSADDASPFYDQNTNTIVWHRLINDRYQIVLYDIESGTEKVITNDNSNNMEPNKQGDYIVWQRWVDGTWNVILLDGDKETQITTGAGNNVAPYIHGSLIVWNRHSMDGVKTIEIYNIESRTYVTVDDPDGLTVSNPRMVFVYDSLAPNGDIVTKGYDLLAKKFIELDSLPTELPEEIPSSDSTGETRALIQSKPVTKSELEEIVNATSTASGTGDDDLGLDNATSTIVVASSSAMVESMTLDLSTTTTQNSNLSTDEVDLSQFDLVVGIYDNVVTNEPSSNLVEASVLTVEDIDVLEFIEPVQE